MASEKNSNPEKAWYPTVSSLQESEIAERFLEQADDESFNAVFRVFSPQLVAFFRRRGHEKGK